MQSNNTPNSFTQVTNDHSWCLEYLNATSTINETVNNLSASENPSFGLLEELNSIWSDFSNMHPREDLPIESNAIDFTTNNTSSANFATPTSYGLHS